MPFLITSTDIHLDWSERNDVYHTFSLTFNYRIKTARNGLPRQTIVQIMFK